MTKSIIISGPPAVGKTTVAHALEREFGFTYVSGGDVLKKMAQDEGFAITGTDWWDRPEGMDFLKKRQQNHDFDRRVDERLIEILRGGDRVITSYTLPWLVKDGIRIWLSGSHENSASRMQTRDDMPVDEAMQITKKRYDENRILYRKMYDFDFGEDLSVFDCIIDTNRLDAEQVISEAIREVRRLQ